MDPSPLSASATRPEPWHIAIACSLALFGCIWATAAPTSAVPLQVVYVGQLDSVAGAPFSGTIDIEVRLYPSDSATGPGIWSQSFPTTPVIDGRISLILGNPGDSTLANALGSGNDLWLEFDIDSTTMAPRQQILSVPSSLYCDHAETLEGHPAADFVQYEAGGDVDVGGDLLAGGLVVAPAFQAAGDPGPCDATLEGAIRYQPVTKTLEVCDGVSWRPVGLVAAADLDVDVSALVIAPISAGMSPGACTEFAITNTGGVAALGLAFEPFSGTDAVHFQTCGPVTSPCGSTLEGGETCNFGIQLLATENGSFNAVAEVSATGSLSAARAIMGTSAGFDPILEITGNNAGMNVTGPATTGTTETFTITNNGVVASSDLTGTVSLGGANPGNFQLGATTCTTSLGVGASCTVDVTPTATDNTSYMATLQLTADNMPSIPLSGTAGGFTPPVASCPGASSVSEGLCEWTAAGAHSIVIPPFVTQVTVMARGAGGSAGGNGGQGGHGGAGGMAQSTVTVTPGTTHTVWVGGGGGAQSGVVPGGFGGGGDSAFQSGCCGSPGAGGGASAFFPGTDTNQTPSVAAGGGGGGGSGGGQGYSGGAGCGGGGYENNSSIWGGGANAGVAAPNGRDGTYTNCCAEPGGGGGWPMGGEAPSFFFATSTFPYRFGAGGGGCIGDTTTLGGGALGGRGNNSSQQFQGNGPKSSGDEGDDGSLRITWN